jgi:hypothetical protein
MGTVNYDRSPGVGVIGTPLVVKYTLLSRNVYETRWLTVIIYEGRQYYVFSNRLKLDFQGFPRLEMWIYC